MSTETDEPRRTIATSSLRALRAARGDTPPPPTSSPDDAPADDTADTVASDEAVDVEDAVDVEEAVDDTDPEPAVEAETDPAAEIETDPVSEVDTVDDEVETDTAVDDEVETDTAVDDEVETSTAVEAEASTGTVTDDAEVETDDAVDATSTGSTGTEVETDDAPPVLASSRPRHTKRTPTATPARARRRPSRLTAISAVVAAVALVFGVVSGVVWWNADHDTARAAAVARDDVVVDARLAVATVNTSDYRKPEAALRNWLAVSTGSLKSQFTDQRKPAITLLGQSKIVTSATVLDAAVTKLDTTKGSATVIVSVNLKRKPATGAATTARNRFRATLTRQGDDWKLADLVLVQFQLQ